MRLDRTRPYDEVFGPGGVALHQDGRLFNMAGFSLDEPIPKNAAELLEEEAAAVTEEPSEGDAAHGVPGSLNDQHWRTLKALVEAYGGTWTNKADAIRFLEAGA